VRRVPAQVADRKKAEQTVQKCLPPHVARNERRRSEQVNQKTIKSNGPAIKRKGGVSSRTQMPRKTAMARKGRSRNTAKRGAPGA